MRQDLKRGFTILELMAAVMILTVIVALASVGYTQYRDRAAMLVDETNQKVLLAAVKLYAYDNNALPGSLSRLRESDVNRAYAQVTSGKQPYTMLAFLKEQIGLFDIAEAAPLPDNYFGGGQTTQAQKLRILTCPIDTTPPAAGGHSYGLHATAKDKPLRWLLDPANAGATIVAESDIANPTDADFAPRHEGGKTFVRTFNSGNVERKHRQTLD